MDFLKSQMRFDFKYGGKAFREFKYDIMQTETTDMLVTEYSLPDGLKITNIAKKYGVAYEWVNWFENTSDMQTDIISELWDCSITLPLGHEEPLGKTAFQPDFHEVTTVFAPSGSTWSCYEFCSDADKSINNRYQGHIPPGKSKQYAASGGRSSEDKAPFFNIHKNGKGYICAIGWTGQWNCSISRAEDEVIVQTKIEDTHFRLLPGEKIRTSSFVLMPYEGTVVQSHNMWRKLVKEHFSLIGREGRDAKGPLCASIWGGTKTSSILERIAIIEKNELPFEYIWMDAGWCGGDTQPSSDEFEGDWASHTGDWRVSPLIHSNNLKDVSDAVHRAGMKFLLWFEPERVRSHTPMVLEHPEYFLEPANPEGKDRILNLGNPEAWTYCYDTLAGLIKEIGIDCYRQDFNTSPLPYWRKYDAEDRRGITEIKHIMGLYQLWDALLEEFPHLLIDNCASGGRRIDIETLRRSVPLWRSDYQCPANYLAEGSQCHNIAFNSWMPFSGTGSGRLYDVYRIRSAYGQSMTTNYAYSEKDDFGNEPEKLEWLKKYLNEYLWMRQFMCEDFYPLTEVSDRKDVWCVTQFDRVSQNDGVIQVFRREQAPYETANFMLGGVDMDKHYVFEDIDSGNEIRISGSELAKCGFYIEMKEKYSSKIYYYKKI